MAGRYEQRDKSGLIQQAGFGARPPMGPPGVRTGLNGRPRESAAIPGIPPVAEPIPRAIQLPNRGVANPAIAGGAGARSPGLVPLPDTMLQPPARAMFSPYPGSLDPNAPKFENPMGGPQFNPLTGEWIE